MKIYTSVELTSNGANFIVHGVYRPPSYDFNLFHDRLEGWLNESCTNQPCLIFGDVNVPVNLSNNNVVLKYKYLLQSYNFLCCNSFVTRPASSNILDHVLCKMSDAHRLTNHTILSDLSDHYLILSEFELHIGSHATILTKNIVNHDRLELEFKNYIDNLGPVLNVDFCLETIISKYNTILKDCTKTISKTANIKNTQCPWMNFDLWTLIKIKSNYLKKCRRDPNNVQLAECLKHVSKKLDTANTSEKKIL